MNHPVTVYRMVITAMMFEPGIPDEDVIQEIENTRHASVSIRHWEKVLVDWDDDHALNKHMSYEGFEQWWRDNYVDED